MTKPATHIKLPKAWNPRSWVSLVPNGIGRTKPNHFLDMARVIWENRRNLRYAWKILTKGVCDGCALGVAGFHDWTIDSTHLCLVRLKLLRLNTMGAMDDRMLEDAETLKGMKNHELRNLGRLPYPMIRRRGDKGFRRLSWETVYEILAERIRSTDPSRFAMYLTSRGITNEVYYVAQKVVRFLGSNNVDNSARICHAPSTAALKSAVGASATTCSYSDWLGTDLILFFGSNAANDQPVSMKYLYYAKKMGARVVCVNPYREPGMEHYWVPSVTESALFGTKITDEFFLVHTGGDTAFIHGVIKWMVLEGWIDAHFIENHTSGFDRLSSYLLEQSWEYLERHAGLDRGEMKKLARMLHESNTAVFVWSMGITQHSSGSDGVRAIINLALTKGYVGREKCGLMPIRGHSGVQGGAEVGAYATVVPGGAPINAETAAALAKLYQFPIRPERGKTAVEMIQAADRNELDVLYHVGGNFLEVLPEPAFVRQAIGRVPLRIYQDIILTNQMLIDPADTVVLLPAKTRYEQRDGGTETTTERRILFSPMVEDRQIGEARSEWEILMELAEQCYPERRSLIHFDSGQAIREEIARVVRSYDGIQHFKKLGDQCQWGGPMLCAGWTFQTPDRKAHFHVVQPRETDFNGRWFRVSTRRGKQFNSMIQAERDPLTGASRDDILINPDDATRLRLKEGAKIVLKNEIGRMEGRVRIGTIRSGNLQVHWPEGNVLIHAHTLEPEVLIPDFNATVEIEIP